MGMLLKKCCSGPATSIVGIISIFLRACSFFLLHVTFCTYTWYLAIKLFTCSSPDKSSFKRGLRRPCRFRSDAWSLANNESLIACWDGVKSFGTTEETSWRTRRRLASQSRKCKWRRWRKVDCRKGSPKLTRAAVCHHAASFLRDLPMSEERILDSKQRRKQTKSLEARRYLENTAKVWVSRLLGKQMESLKLKATQKARQILSSEPSKQKMSSVSNGTCNGTCSERWEGRWVRGLDHIWDR